MGNVDEKCILSSECVKVIDLFEALCDSWIACIIQFMLDFGYHIINNICRGECSF